MAVGLGFWKRERRVDRFGGQTLIVCIGRLAGGRAPSMPMLGGLAMELVVTPLMFLWHLRLGRGMMP